MKTFTPLIVASKFFKYSLPLNLDSYRFCSFKCEYCFMKNRKIGNVWNEHLPPNIRWLKRTFEKVYDNKDVDKSNFLEMLLKNRITLNCGTKSDPFQPREKEEQFTKQIIDLCNEYNQKLIFSTKSDSYYDVGVTPDNHSFQLSITNHYDDKYLEPNVPSFQKKVDFYHKLKDEGFKVGIRFEPFIPHITDMEKCLSYFEDVDHVHISRLRLLPQQNNDKLLAHIGCNIHDFKGKGIVRGLLALKPDVWYNYVKKTVDYLEENNYSYSSSFIHIGNCDGLGGDSLGWKTSTFDTFHLKQKYGDNWTMEDGLNEIGEYKDCDCTAQFTSNRWYGCRTVEEFYKHRWNKSYTKFHPKNQYKPPKTTLLDYY